MKLKVIVVMPAYNAALTVEKTVKEIPEGFANYWEMHGDIPS